MTKWLVTELNFHILLSYTNGYKKALRGTAGVLAKAIAYIYPQEKVRKRTTIMDYHIMQMNKITQYTDIKPYIGIGNICLGSTRRDILRICGKPDRHSVINFSNGSCDKDWEYFNFGLTLCFSSTDGWVLGTINVESEKAALFGHNFIGLREAEFLEKIKQSDIPPIVLEDDFVELGSRDYMCDELGLSFWIQDGIVDSITIFPRYDKSGETPIWPQVDDLNSSV